MRRDTQGTEFHATRLLPSRVTTYLVCDLTNEAKYNKGEKDRLRYRNKLYIFMLCPLKDRRRVGRDTLVIKTLQTTAGSSFCFFFFFS